MRRHRAQTNQSENDSIHLRGLFIYVTKWHEYLATWERIYLPEGVLHFPALSAWRSDAYLLNKLADANLSVALTPDG